MNNIKSTVTIFITCILLLCGCDKDKLVNHDDDDESIQSTSSYLVDNVDKEKWGDFLLILELSKSTFDKKSSFLFKLSFQNTGSRTIVLDGILPYRQSANPPYINIWSDDSTYYQINKVSDDLLSEEEIIIEPEQQMILIQGDLNQVSGTVFRIENTGISYNSEDVDDLGFRLKSGEYKVQGHFHPTPQIYFSDTDTLIITVE